MDGAETVLQSGEARLIDSGEFVTVAFLPNAGAAGQQGGERTIKQGGESNRMQKKEKARARAPGAASISLHAASIAVTGRNRSGRRNID